MLHADPRALGCARDDLRAGIGEVLDPQGSRWGVGPPPLEGRVQARGLIDAARRRVDDVAGRRRVVASLAVLLAVMLAIAGARVGSAAVALAATGLDGGRTRALVGLDGWPTVRPFGGVFKPGAVTAARAPTLATVRDL